MLRKIAFALVAAASLGGCSSTGLSSRYGPLNLLGGYKDKLVGEHTWRVEGVGNGYTRRGYGEDTAVHRAAEVAKAAGFSHIQIVDQEVTRRFVGHTRADQFAGENAILKVKGTNTPDDPLACEAKEADKCFTLSVEDVLARVGPRLEQRAPGSETYLNFRVQQ